MHSWSMRRATDLETDRRRLHSFIQSINQSIHRSIINQSVYLFQTGSKCRSVVIELLWICKFYGRHSVNVYFLLTEKRVVNSAYRRWPILSWTSAVLVCFQFSHTTPNWTDWPANIFMKTLKNNDIEIIKYCQQQFGFKLSGELVADQTDKFNGNIIAFNCIR